MTSDKKVIEIHGVLQKPLEIGSSAFILEDNGIRRTSTVLEYKQVSENEIHFETLNTIYHLRLKQNKSLCGVNRDDILLNPKDLFNIAKALKLQPIDVVKQYCETFIGESSQFPIIR